MSPIPTARHRTKPSPLPLFVEWLRWPYASELPGSHTVAIAAVDEAGNVDPEPAVWTWSVDARPRTSLTSAPQAVTAVDTAFFSFACALPESEATPSPSSGVNPLSSSDNEDSIRSATSGGENGDDETVLEIAPAPAADDDEAEAEVDENNETAVDDGSVWEVHEGGACVFFFSLDGGNYSAVEPAAAAAAAAAGEPSSMSSSSSSSSSSSVVPSSNTLLLTGLADGAHELSTECDPQPLSHSWETDTLLPVTTILSFPDKLMPSVFTFGSSKPLSRFMCKVDSGMWRQCDETSQFPLSDGLHSVVVMAVDPTGRSDPNPITYNWEVSMLETVVEFCPPSHLPFQEAETQQVLLGASYDGVACAPAMSCQIRYVLQWEAPVPASSAADCVAPPSPAPTAAPVPTWSLSPTREGVDNDDKAGGGGGGGSGASSSGGETRGGDGDDGGDGSGLATPGETGGGTDDDGGGGSDGGGPAPGQNYLSRSVVLCAEAWANCSTLAANTSYSYQQPASTASGEGGCTKLETLQGQMGHSHGTLVMQNLGVGDYKLALEAFNVFGVVDRSPVVCPFRVLAEGESINQTQGGEAIGRQAFWWKAKTFKQMQVLLTDLINQTPVPLPGFPRDTNPNSQRQKIVMVRTPAKVLNRPEQAPFLFEFEVEDVLAADDISANTWTSSSSSSSAATANANHTESAAADSSATPSSSSSAADAAARLSYLLSGPGAGDAWEAVPAVPRAEWDALLLLAGDNNGTSSISSPSASSSSSSSAKRGSDNGGFVWGLELEGLEDGEYRLQVRDEVLGDTAEYTWRVDMSVPELSLDAMPQNPSHSAEAIFVLRCSKLSCGLEYQLNDDGVWRLWVAAAADVEHTHSSRAPTPAPAVAHMLGSGSDDEGGGAGADSGDGGSDAAGDDEGDGGEEPAEDVEEEEEEENDTVFVGITAQQVSSHELSFRVNVTVPESGNYSLAARPSSSAAVFAPGAIIGSVPGGVDDDDGNGNGNGNGRRRRLDFGTSSSSSSSSDAGVDSDTVKVDWEVDLTRPETRVVSRPSPVMTTGVAAFQFACSLAGEEPSHGCFYQYQMMVVNSETDWDRLEWLPTADSVTLYEIGEGVNRIRVRAHDSETELYDLAPAEVVWVRDATPPQVEWLWTPEEVSHLSNALFEFTCLGELPLPATVFGDEADPEEPVDMGQREQEGQAGSSSSSSSSSPWLRSSPSSSSGSGTQSEAVAIRDDDDASAVGAAAIAAAYPTAFPRVLPSGCAFEASLDGADFEAVPNTVVLSGLSNGDHRFSVRASDLAGNVAATSYFDWTVDTNVPDTVVVACPSSVASSPLATFKILDTVGAEQDEGHFEYRLDPLDDDTAWTTTSNTTLEFMGLQDGTHALTVRARETLAEGGSSDQVPEVVTWEVDTECPDTTFVVLPEVVTHLTSTVLVVEGGPDAASFEYTLDPIETNADNNDDDDDDDDDAEEAGSSGGTAASRDSSSGSSSSSTSTSSTTTSGGEGKGEEAGVVWEQGDSSGVIHLYDLEEGRHEIRVRAVDSAGNADPSPATYSWIVDRADVYGHPSMVTDVVAEGGNKQAFVQWSAAADDGGGDLTKYVVIASTAYADINVEAITYSGSDCSVVASGTSPVLGAYPGSWGECDMKCGGGVRRRKVQCLEFLDGIPLMPLANDTSCWEELGETPESRLAMTERSCRNVACLAMFLDVTMRLRAFYDDACFTVAAQDAFLSGFAAEVAHALNIKVELVIDLNAFHTDKHNEMEVRFIIAPGQTGADQPIENLREQLLLQAASETSSFRSHGTWTRKLIPESVEVSQGTYELPSLNVSGIASDLVMILMGVGTSCLAVAVYGACSSRKSKKWETVYDGEYGDDDSTETPPSREGRRGSGRRRFDGNTGGNRLDVDGNGAAGGTGGGGGGGGGDGDGRGCVRRHRRWFELDDSEDYDSEDEDDEEWDDEDETSPFFGRCALRSLLCRDDKSEGDEEAPASCQRGGSADCGGDGDGDGAKAGGDCGCTCEYGRSSGRQGGGGVEAGTTGRGSGGGCTSGRCCTCRNDDDGLELTRGPAIDLSSVDLDKLPLPLTGRSKPMPPLSGEAVLYRRRGWGFDGGGGSGSGSGSGRGRCGGCVSSGADEEDGGGGTVVRARGMGGGRGSGGAGVRDGHSSDGLLGIQRPGRQALV
ncbi:unnamed protein product [Ectocarpus sp. CCAP 1310/34]|nr:unnamed protein product [Ectocarpus sp. CCAP 1310/34]